MLSTLYRNLLLTGSGTIRIIPRRSENENACPKTTSGHSGAVTALKRLPGAGPGAFFPFTESIFETFSLYWVLAPPFSK
ncbi:MAG TPA: hypothetical protein DEB39_05140 [Planctomycetaceae bacterium]|nr:hypothetical protein [Planctomycetaceae bacterium]